MWSKLYDVCCLSNSYNIVCRHNRRFNYRSQFQDLQKPHHHISHHAVAVWRRHYRPRIKSQKTSRLVEGVNPQPSEQLQSMTIKISASTEMATVAYISVCVASVLSERRIERSCRRWYKHLPVRRLLWMAMPTPKHVTSDDLLIEVPLRVMVWYWILASYCQVPSHINCILLVFSFRRFDVIHSCISSMHVVTYGWSINSMMQLWNDNKAV